MPTADTSQILARGLDLLAFLCARREPVGVRELSRELGWSRSSVQRLLNGLKASGFVNQNEAGRYLATQRVVSLARDVLDGIRLNEVAADVLADVARRCGETAALFVLDGPDRVCIASVESALQPRDVVPIGARRPAHLGASGKVLLAFLKEGAPSAARAYSRPASRRGASEWRAKLERVRAEGYAVSHGERAPGLSAVAAPVRDGSGAVVAALTLSGPTTRFGPDRVKELVRLVIATVRRLSDELKLGRVREGRTGL